MADETPVRVLLHAPPGPPAFATLSLCRSADGLIRAVRLRGEEFLAVPAAPLPLRPSDLLHARLHGAATLALCGPAWPRHLFWRASAIAMCTADEAAEPLRHLRGVVPLRGGGDAPLLGMHSLDAAATVDGAPARLRLWFTMRDHATHLWVLPPPPGPTADGPFVAAHAVPLDDLVGARARGPLLCATYILAGSHHRVLRVTLLQRGQFAHFCAPAQQAS